MNNKQKLKNPIFWMGVIVTVFVTAGIPVESLTDWPVVGESFMGIVLNPYKLGLVGAAVYAMWNDNSVKKPDGFRLK